MVNYPAGIDIRQGFECHRMTLLLLIDPGASACFITHPRELSSRNFGASLLNAIP
jgi:hypothetical protein